MTPTALAACALLLVLVGCDRLAALAASNPLQSFESRCEALPASGFQIRRLPLAVRDDYSMSYAQLARLSEPSAVNHRTVGLTRAKFGYRSTLELEGLEDPRSTRACVRPKVNVNIEVTNAIVHVAREYRGDACREPLILEHERRHVEVFSTYAAEIAPTLARGLETSIGNRLTYGSTMAGAQASIKEALDAELGVFLAQASDELARRNAAIDTADEYERLARECGPSR